jgi:hypothetical protein
MSSDNDRRVYGEKLDKMQEVILQSYREEFDKLLNDYIYTRLGIRLPTITDSVIPRIWVKREREAGVCVPATGQGT